MASVVMLDTGGELEVGKIVAAGSNYADHTKEMGMPRPEAPVLFLKPSTSIIHEGQDIVFPETGNLLHHEVELGLVIGDGCKNVEQRDALNHVAGYLLALDLTLRDLQSDAKSRGLPWATAKGFDCACPISGALPLTDRRILDDLELGLKVNGQTRQLGSTAHMVWGSDELVAISSRFFTLEPGDILLTGTPAGVGPLERGDVVEAWLGSELSLKFAVR